MRKLLLLLILLGKIFSELYAQSEYSQHEILTNGLNVPAQILFNSDGILFVANHTYASYPGEYSNTIARIDEYGNKSVFVSGYMWPSGLAIDKEDNLFFTQNNAGSVVYKVLPDAQIEPFVALPHQPGPITLFDNGNPEAFALYTISHWGTQGIYLTDYNGVSTLVDAGAYGSCELSGNGEFLYLTILNSNLMLRYNTLEGTLENWNSSLKAYDIWASTIGPDEYPYFIARSITDTLNKAVYRINGYNDVTEVLNKMPLTSDFGDLAFKKRGNIYDLYLTEVVNHDRMNPEANRVIVVRDVFKFERLPGAAGPVSGPDRVCQGETEVWFSVDPVTNATGYTWNLPPGFAITEGENTNSIRVSVSDTAVSGMVTVFGTNTDGVGPASPSLSITVHPLPADLGEPITQYIDLETGLVASYPFNGNSEDETGNGNNGSVIGNVELTSDRYGNANSAYEFPGLAFNYISVPHSSYLELNTFTISAWIFTETDYGYGQVVQKNRDIVSGHYGLYTSQFGGTVSYGVGVGIGVSVDPAIGEWHMVTGTLFGNFAAFYTDGQLLADTIAPNSYQYSGTDPMAIGMHYYEGVPDYWTYPYRGKIDDILIYNRVLSPEEIQCLYTGDCQQLVLSATQGETTLCRGGTSSITLFNAQAGVSYQVKDNNQDVGLPQTGNADTLMFNLPDIFANKAFTILATDTATGCSRVLDSVFRVNVVPVEAEIEASLSSTFAPAMASLSSVSQAADSWTWLVNGEVVSATEQTQLELTQPGEYEIVLQVVSSQPWQCTDADTTLLSLQEQVIVLFEFPPAFSPNGDGYNDVFVPAAEGVDAYSVVVKDTWGRTMAEFDRSSSGWSGNTTGGAEAPAGAYYYQANATDYNGISLDRSGVVYLIRDLIDLTPNPVADKLVVSMNGRLAGRKHLRILQVSGKEIYSTDFEGESLTLDTSWLDKAMYIMQISNDTNVVNVKFVKE